MVNNSNEHGFSKRLADRKERFMKYAAAWLGYGDRPDQPPFLTYADDLQLAMYDEEMANHINLHIELADGACSCGLVLQYPGIPLQAQAGHIWEGDPVSIFLFDTPDGIKQQCQECLFEWPAMPFKCSHAERDEGAQCHYCMHGAVERAAKKGCKGHKVDRAEPSIMSQIFKVAQPGIGVYLWVLAGNYLFEYAIAPNFFPHLSNALPKMWMGIALAGFVLWLASIYIDAEKEKSEKIKARAIGAYIWAGYSLVLPWLFNELDELFALALAALGFS